MREVVQFLSDSGVYFDFSTRLLHLEDGTSISVHDYQSNLLRFFTLNPDVIIQCKQVASLDFEETSHPDKYKEVLSTESDCQLALEYLRELWGLDPIFRKVLIVYSRFGCVYNGNKLMLVENDWKPASVEMVDDQSTQIVNQVTSRVTEAGISFPYEGEKPFVFVSYAHKNSTEAMGILNMLKECGLRIWYDEGIEWGSEWPQSIAEHLKKCTLFLAFHSKESIVSSNCRQEVAYAIKNRKTILSVYLEDVELPDGMDMQLSIYQAISKNSGESPSRLAHRLLQYQLLKNCLEIKKFSEKEDRLKKRTSKIFSIALFSAMVIGICVQPFYSPFIENTKWMLIFNIGCGISNIFITLYLKLLFSDKFESCENEKVLYSLSIIPLVMPLLMQWMICMMLPGIAAIIMCITIIAAIFAFWRILF